jgi:hypothetical protein
MLGIGSRGGRGEIWAGVTALVGLGVESDGWLGGGCAKERAAVVEEGGRSRPTRSRRPWGRRDPGGAGGRGVRGSEEGEGEARWRGSRRREETEGRGGSGVGFGIFYTKQTQFLAVRSQMNGLK